MNARRRSASSHSVNSSSNWSTTTQPVRRVRRRRATGSAPGVEQRGVREPVDLAGAHGGDDAGAQQRGLAAARRADDGEQPAGREPADRRRPRPPRGRRRSGGRPASKAEQAAVRALGRRRRRSTPGPASADALRRADAPSRCGPRSTSEQPSGRCPATSSPVTADRKIWPPSACARTRAARLTRRADVVARAARPRPCAGPSARRCESRRPARPQRAVGGERGRDRGRRRVEDRDGRVARPSTR